MNRLGLNALIALGGDPDRAQMIWDGTPPTGDNHWQAAFKAEVAALERGGFIALVGECYALTALGQEAIDRSRESLYPSRP